MARTGNVILCLDVNLTSAEILGEYTNTGDKYLWKWRSWVKVVWQRETGSDRQVEFSKKIIIFFLAIEKQNFKEIFSQSLSRWHSQHLHVFVFYFLVGNGGRLGFDDRVKKEPSWPKEESTTSFFFFFLPFFLFYLLFKFQSVCVCVSGLNVLALALGWPHPTTFFSFSFFLFWLPCLVEIHVWWRIEIWRVICVKFPARCSSQ